MEHLPTDRYTRQFEIKPKKDEIRAEYKKRRLALSPDDKRARDARICEFAVNLASFRFAEYVLMYAATPNEIDICGIAREALKRSKKVAFPRCFPETHTMSYHIISSLDELSPDNYGIAEPPQDLPVYDPENDLGSAVCFVPGLVYDREGYRLGYGKGFYDRFLSSFAGSSIGVVYSDFILNEVPRGRFDMKVDILLTEKGVRTSES